MTNTEKRPFLRKGMRIRTCVWPSISTRKVEGTVVKEPGYFDVVRVVLDNDDGMATWVEIQRVELIFLPAPLR